VARIIRYRFSNRETNDLALWRIADRTARLCWWTRSILQILVIAHCVAAAGLAGEPVVAHARDGRSLSGVVDERTTSTRLWLRLTESNIVALSSVDWRDVMRIETRGRDYSAEQFRPLAERQKSNIPANVFVKLAGDRDGPVGDGRRDNAVGSRAAPRVQSVRIDAEVANWDWSAETDGIEVRVYPLAADRMIAPVSGILTVELFGQKITPDQMFEPVREDYSRLDRWSVRLTPVDFGREGFAPGDSEGREAVVRLPFRRVHPEFEVDVRNFGQLNASLLVTGQGVYDATVPINLRSFSPIRERLQQSRRSRFFPGERTGPFPHQYLGVFPGDVTGK
jgi:hypothetical protein